MAVVILSQPVTLPIILLKELVCSPGVVAVVGQIAYVRLELLRQRLGHLDEGRVGSIRTLNGETRLDPLVGVIDKHLTALARGGDLVCDHDVFVKLTLVEGL